MGVISTLLTVVAGTGAVVYLAGRRGVVGFARLAGATLGSSVARARRARGDLQRQLVDAQTPEQQEVALKMQKNMWRARMIANEVTMVRNLSPRLLHRGNYGFTDEEVLDALAAAAPGVGARAQAVSRSDQLDAHAARQLEMEGQSISDPAMYPLAGRHGSSADTAIMDPDAGRGIQPRARQSGTHDQASNAVATSPGAAAPIDALDPALQQYHWSNLGDDIDPVTGFVRQTSPPSPSPTPPRDGRR